MGITPSLPVALERMERPDVVHVLGFRDVVSTGVAAWAWLRRIPYVFEPLGMFEPRLRKVALKRGLDATLYRGVVRGASTVVVSSEREAGHVRALAADRVRVRGNGFPDPESMPADRGVLRGELGIPDSAPIVLYVGRIASGKGIEHLLTLARELTDVHLVLVGPDDRHGAIDQVRAAQASGRVHALGATTEPPLHLYPEADVLCLPSAGESFGMAAAEAAAAGTPVVVTDRCGIASFFCEGEALVVPYGAAELTDAVRSVLENAELRRSLIGGRRGGGASNVVGARDGTPGRDLPGGDRFPASHDEVLDRRLVAPRPRKLARAVAVRAAQLAVAGESLQSLGSGRDVAVWHEHAVLPHAQQVGGSAYAIRQHERQAGRRRLVDRHAPRLMGR